MPNLAVLLRGEIARLARKTNKADSTALRSAIAAQKRETRALRERVAALEGSLKRVMAGVAKGDGSSTSAADTPALRFRRDGLKAHRARVELSAGDYGTLVGVSGQTVYSWEQGHSTPRAAQLMRLASLRGIGKREAMRRLAANTPAGTTKPRSRAARG